MGISEDWGSSALGQPTVPATSQPCWALVCKNPVRSSVENTSITSIAPALALLTTGVSGQLQGFPIHRIRLGHLKPGSLPSPGSQGLEA